MNKILLFLSIFLITSPAMAAPQYQPAPMQDETQTVTTFLSNRADQRIAGVYRVDDFVSRTHIFIMTNGREDTKITAIPMNEEFNKDSLENVKK